MLRKILVFFFCNNALKISDTIIAPKGDTFGGTALDDSTLKRFVSPSYNLCLYLMILSLELNQHSFQRDIFIFFIHQLEAVIVNV